MLDHFIRIGFAISSLFLVVWWGSALWTESSKPSLYSAAQEIEFSVSEGEGVVVGRKELMQPSGATSAEKEHVRFFISDGNNLMLRRVAKKKRLYLKFKGIDGGIYSDRYPVDMRIGVTTELSFGSGKVSITHETTKSLRIEISRIGSKSKKYIVSLAGRGRGESGDLLEPCVEKWSFSKLAAVREKLGIPADTVAEFSGTKACNYNRKALLPVEGVDEEVSFILIHSKNGKLYIAPGRNTDRVPVGYKTYNISKLLQSHHGAQGLEWLVSEVTNSGGRALIEGFIAGRTKYQIIATPLLDTWTVALKPITNIPYFDGVFCKKAQLEPVLYPDADEICPLDIDRVEHTLIPKSLVRLLSPMKYNTQEGGLVFFLCIMMSLILALSIYRKAKLPLSYSLRSWVESLAAGATVFALLVPIILFLSFNTYSYFSLKINLIALIIPYLAVSIVLTLNRPGGTLLSIFWFFLVLIVAIGSLSLFTLSAEGFNSEWERYFVKHKNFVLMPLAPAFLIVSLLSSNSLQYYIGNELTAGQKPNKSMFLYLVLSVFIGLLLWVFFGTQAGLANVFQPVELGKFTVVLVLSSILARLLIRTRIFSPIWVTVNIFYIIAAIAFFMGLFFAPLLKSDWSPLLIVLITSSIVVLTGFFLLSKSLCIETIRDIKGIKQLPKRFIPTIVHISTPRQGFGLIIIMVLLVCLFHSNRDLLTAKFLTLPIWSWDFSKEQKINILLESMGDGRSVPKQRLISYLDLEYPEEVSVMTAHRVSFTDFGYQSLRSRAAIAKSGCSSSATYQGGWLGDYIAQSANLAAVFFRACEGNGRDDHIGSYETLPCTPLDLKAPALPHCIPVIESDFSATYLIARHGRPIAILLAIGQIGLLLPLVATFLILQNKRSRDPVITGANQSLGLIAVGAATLLLLQWSMAWANAFTMLPVMGQPMTWLSAATSHHLFMGIPIVIASICAIRVAGQQRTHLVFRQPPRL